MNQRATSRTTSCQCQSQWQSRRQPKPPPILAERKPTLRTIAAIPTSIATTRRSLVSSGFYGNNFAGNARFNNFGNYGHGFGYGGWGGYGGYRNGLMAVAGSCRSWADSASVTV